MNDIFNQLGKARDGYVSIDSDGSRGSVLTYLLTDNKAALDFDFSEKENRLLLHSIQYFTLESQRESTERTSDDYSALIPQPGQEGWS